MTHISQLIHDHHELTNGSNGDEYYIEKLHATFEEHKDMLSHLQTLDSQEKMIQQQLGVKLMTRTYGSVLFEVKEYATILDNRYGKN